MAKLVPLRVVLTSTLPTYTIHFLGLKINFSLSQRPVLFFKGLSFLQNQLRLMSNGQNISILMYLRQTPCHEFTLHYAEERRIVPFMTIEFIISGLITNGYSRLGWGSELQGTIKLTKNTDNTPNWENIPAPEGNFWTSGKGDDFSINPEESRDWVKLRIVSIIKGYSYNTQGPGPNSAIALLLIYCTLAFGHCFCSVISGTWVYFLPAAPFIRDFRIS